MLRTRGMRIRIFDRRSEGAICLRLGARYEMQMLGRFGMRKGASFSWARAI